VTDSGRGRGATVETASGTVQVPERFLPDSEFTVLSLKCWECGERAEIGGMADGRWLCLDCPGGYR